MGSINSRDSCWVGTSWSRVVATAYFSKAASKMAEKDFEDFGFQQFFKST